MIGSRYNTAFTVSKKTETKVDGRLITAYTEDTTGYKCAIFTPSSQRAVNYGKKQFIIEKNLYCDVTVPLELGDYVTVDDGKYDVITLKNTNNLNHHFSVGLVTRNI